MNNFPSFENFLAIVKRVNRAFDEKPTELKVGQVWGLEQDSPAKWLIIRVREHDVRAVPITTDIWASTPDDIIIPKGAVYYGESVIFPRHATLVLKNNLLTYWADLSHYVEYLYTKDTPSGCYRGEADFEDPIIREFDNELAVHKYSLMNEALFLEEV